MVLHCVWKKVTPRHHTTNVSNLYESVQNFVHLIPNKLLRMIAKFR